MTEKEVKQTLFQIRFEYKMLPPEEQEKYYEEYIQKLEEMKKKLTRLVMERRENELKIK